MNWQFANSKTELPDWKSNILKKLKSSVSKSPQEDGQWMESAQIGTFKVINDDHIEIIENSLQSIQLMRISISRSTKCLVCSGIQSLGDWNDVTK